MADQLNSLSFILPELARFLCFYSSQISWRDGMNYIPLTDQKNATDVAQTTVPRCALNSDQFVRDSCQCTGVLFGLEPILRTLPAWFRFAQCLRRYRDMEVKKTNPHILNAGKYSTTFFVTVSLVWVQLAPSIPALVCLAISHLANSTYTYSWDILMDWGLMELHSDNRLLRDELVYRYKAYYYVAIAEDLILRFTWVIRLSVQRTHPDKYELTVTILYAAEVIRRFIWNFFRLENEHLNNCGEFRAVRDIFITPLPKRPPRTVSTQLFSTNFGSQQKHNAVYPTNNSALNPLHLHHHLRHRHNHHSSPKSKHDDTWTLPPTMLADTNKSFRMDASTSPDREWSRAVQSSADQSRAWRLLNRISTATTMRLPRRTANRPTNHADYHHRHYHFQHHIMDNMELTESLRSTLPRSARDEEIASHSTDGEYVPTQASGAGPNGDSPDRSASTPNLLETGRTRSGSLAQQPSPLHSSTSDRVNNRSEDVSIQRLSVVATPSTSTHCIPVVRVTRSRSHNDLENCVRTDMYDAHKIAMDSSCDTISSMDMDAGMLHPTDTSITLLSHDRDRMSGSSGSVNVYRMLGSSLEQRPRFTATSYSSLESPTDPEEARPLPVERVRQAHINPSPLVDSPLNERVHTLEVVQNDSYSLRPIYPRVIGFTYSVAGIAVSVFQLCTMVATNGTSVFVDFACQ
ncbi:unnamed protein product [Echinostoma caproni]|uniref:EXS domain-containing protein n=1 Tax=Echinostoma caproni TaxID=27848 RepID=A0A3P8G9A2_9TREM|nr:unnamed protein product [Echinostoma caproni]